MHELSIACRIVEIASERARAANAQKITSITLRIGALSCVHKNALEFSFELITRDTLLEGSRLQFIDVPVAIFCSACEEEKEIPSIQRFRCPDCDTPSANIRKGRELDIECIEIVEKDELRVS